MCRAMTFWLGPLGMSRVRPHRVSRSLHMTNAVSAESANAGPDQRPPSSHAPAHTAETIVSRW